MKKTLTHSSISTFKTCNYKYWLRYELGINKAEESKPLRFGSAYHRGLELLSNGHSFADACEDIRDGYASIECPDPFMRFDLDVECEQVLRLLAGHQAVYHHDPIEPVETELAFEIQFSDFVLAGKIDRIIRRVVTGQLFIEEYKTTSDDLAPESDYWRKLTMNEQISRYTFAARKLGFNVAGVLFDVVRKPKIEPRKLSQAETQGFLLNKAYCQSTFDIRHHDDHLLVDGEKVELIGLKKGFTIRESVRMYGARISYEIANQTAAWFARREVSRSDDELANIEQAIRKEQKLITFCQRTGNWVQNGQACLTPYRCEFTPICFNRVNPVESIPSGFKRVENVHPELGEAYATNNAS
jgi:hypothetical protein